MKDIKTYVSDQRLFAKTLPLQNCQSRIDILKKLKHVININEDNLIHALKLDLGKSEFESCISEIDFINHEIDYFIKHLKKWMKPQKVRNSLVFYPVKSYIYSEPFGTSLIIAPWNYPFQLLISPAVAAIGAGNTVVLKPSEITPATSKLIASMINDNFDPRLLIAIEGAIPETTELLDQKFDYIFYTGNAMVGRIILEKAARNLTPVTLELGGKSPCLVYSDQVDLSAKRIMWGKFFNTGQTCVAPDYVIIPKDSTAEFISSCKKWINVFYGENKEASNDYGRIVSDKHFERLLECLEGADILIGGDSNKESRFISPTILKATKGDKVMEDEIFGPILPIIELDTIGEAIDFVNSSEKPLAAYAFLDSDYQKDRFISEVSSGGMVINDTIVHLTNNKLPFGGVGLSGMGSYHGKFGFDLFGHKKSVMKRSFKLENNLRYPPYENKLRIMRKLIKLFS